MHTVCARYNKLESEVLALTPAQLSRHLAVIKRERQEQKRQNQRQQAAAQSRRR